MSAEQKSADRPTPAPPTPDNRTRLRDLSRGIQAGKPNR